MALIAIAVAGTGANAQADSLYAKIPAQEIMAAANSSRIAYDRIIVVGDLDLGGMQYNSIRITNSVIEGNASGKGATFVREVDFSNTSFRKDAVFNQSKFLAEVNFNSSSFWGTASFNMSRFPEGCTFDFVTFQGPADFANAGFDKFATFYSAVFTDSARFPLSEFSGSYANFDRILCQSPADFSGSQFNAYASFEESQFERGLDFHATKFASGAVFFNGSFQGDANFARCHFVEDSIFSGSVFNGTALFPNAKFDGPVFFNGTVFCQNAIFDNTQFQALADLSYVRFDRDLAMNSTKITKMVLDGSQFDARSRLFLAKADINRFMASWSLIRGILSFDTSAYLSLIKNYKDLGQGNDANDCYYEYRYLNQVHKEFGVSKFLDIVAWLTCGYGVRPHYALLFGMAIILICALIFRSGRGVEGFAELHGWHLMAASLYFSTIAFTANSKGLPLKGRYKYLGIAEGIVGWLLMALFLVTLGRLIIG